MNWFHMSSEVLSSATSASSRSLTELALACWEYLILSSLNLAHVAGTETLVKNWKQEENLTNGSLGELFSFSDNYTE